MILVNTTFTAFTPVFEMYIIIFSQSANFSL